ACLAVDVAGTAWILSADADGTFFRMVGGAFEALPGGLPGARSIAVGSASTIRATVAGSSASAVGLYGYRAGAWQSGCAAARRHGLEQLPAGVGGSRRHDVAPRRVRHALEACDGRALVELGGVRAARRSLIDVPGGRTRRGGVGRRQRRSDMDVQRTVDSLRSPAA